MDQRLVKPFFGEVIQEQGRVSAWLISVLMLQDKDLELLTFS